MNEPAELLLVDDDEVFRERLARALRARGRRVETAKDADEALVVARRSPPAFAVVDLRMPGRSGLELVRELRALSAATTIVVLTGWGSIATAVEAVRDGAADFLAKPVDPDELLATLDRRGKPPPPAGAPDAQPPPAPSLARAEWEHIQRVLADVGGNVSEAARRLGLHRRSLQRKLQKFPPSR